MFKLSNHRSDSNHNPPRGGQASLGLFGLPGTNPRRVPTATTPSFALPDAFVVRLRRNRFRAFARLAERERRPVGEVLAEWLSDCAARIGRDELLAGSKSAMTPAMRLAAVASDERERRGSADDADAEFAHRCHGAGYVEIMLAMDC